MWLSPVLALFTLATHAELAEGELRRLVLLTRHGEAELRPELDQPRNHAAGSPTTFFGKASGGEDQAEVSGDGDFSGPELSAAGAARLREVGAALRARYLLRPDCGASETCLPLPGAQVRAETSNLALALASAAALHAGLLPARAVPVPIFTRPDRALRGHALACPRLEAEAAKARAQLAEESVSLRRRAARALLASDRQFLAADEHEVPLEEWQHAQDFIEKVAASTMGSQGNHSSRALVSAHDLASGRRLAARLERLAAGLEPLHEAGGGEQRSLRRCGGALLGEVVSFLADDSARGPQLLHYSVDGPVLLCLLSALGDVAVLSGDLAMGPDSVLAMEVEAREPHRVRLRLWGEAAGEAAAPWRAVASACPGCSALEFRRWAATSGAATGISAASAGAAPAGAVAMEEAEEWCELCATTDTASCWLANEAEGSWRSLQANETDANESLGACQCEPGVTDDEDYFTMNSKGFIGLLVGLVLAPIVLCVIGVQCYRVMKRP